MLANTYNPLLVVCSLLVAILAAYTALDMAGRIALAEGRTARWWMIGGGCAMGLGIWSMHFVGMLAFNLPIALGYDPAITSLSLLIAVAASMFALWLVCQNTLPMPRLVVGALLMGPAIAGMHYTGMAAMRMRPGIDYDATLVALSVSIAIVASGAALWIAFRLRQRSAGRFLLRAVASLVMGVAIVGMHYTGMAAAHFPAGSICDAARDGANPAWLALVVIVVTLAVIAIALIISVLDLRMEARTAVLAASLAEANKELAYLALHDSLTGLPNRVLLEDRLAQLVRGARHSKRRFTLMFMDLDSFKAVNDALGHHVGDKLLVEVSRRLRAALPSHDTIARVGGDEFVLLSNVEDATAAADVAQALTRAIEAPFEVETHAVHISLSVGIAIYPDNGADQQELLSNADAAMYHAKALGSGSCCFFEPSMQADVYEQMQLAHELRSAVAAGEMVLHYQPKFGAASGEAVGAEALLRWNHPVRGLLSPDHFIPLAEKTGLIVSIGMWVLDESCRQLKLWHCMGRTGWSIAVNLSPLQFVDDGLVKAVQDVLRRHDLPAHCLILEVTETTAMRDVDVSLTVLRQLRHTGVQIAIDDFGTGYSSLVYLKRLPATELKIDRAFVRQLSHGTEDAAIVSAVIALGRTLNLRIVAEGVETHQQRTYLTDVGCDMLQGFLLGRPMSADAFVEALMPCDAALAATHAR
ncbi:putative bifunctional diguanylate cyclase/phosphodiesterase [Caballeronia concitans]|uniref:Diguanylate cyclase/phosphodiesterase n=1 Tax=Caballeronia concitans TaxID=1777133 RepID=A0A658R032_9BURK|nr:bifunctional diguanylate cyclase/phosphodiesterase [Caballeronia concitans]SAL35843.1 diguanylate cyclase/phosphodiesterase [Caballeronia concitans]